MVYTLPTLVLGITLGRDYYFMTGCREFLGRLLNGGILAKPENFLCKYLTVKNNLNFTKRGKEGKFVYIFKLWRFSDN